MGVDIYPSNLLLQQWAYFYNTILEDTNESDSLIISYEQMLHEPVKTVTALYEYLGLSIQSVDFQNGLLTVGHNQLSVRKNNNSPDSSLVTREDINEQISAIAEKCLNALPRTDRTGP